MFIHLITAETPDDLVSELNHFFKSAESESGELEVVSVQQFVVSQINSNTITVSGSPKVKQVIQLLIIYRYGY